jgi:hypothetical protein
LTPVSRIKDIESFQFEEEIMKSRRIITLLGFVCVLVLGIPSTLVAGNPDAGTWITTDASGQISISTALYTHPNGRSWSLVMESSFMDWSFGGEFENIAPIQELCYGEGWMTGAKTLENVTMQRIRRTDGSVAYIVIGRGKGTIIDSKTIKLNSRLYFFLDLDQDGLPDFQMGEPYNFFYTSRHLSEAVPFLKSLPAPDNYPEP